MLSKNQIKLINQLNQKKYRLKNELFIAEGIKTVKEFLNSEIQLYKLYATADILSVNDVDKYEMISEKELKKISQLKTPQMLLGVFEILQRSVDAQIQLNLVLDGVRDPGNLGTIIRLCDWFGITQIVCSTDTVDCYNPKTVQASMGSLSRINIVYTDLEEYLTTSNLPVYGTFMDGDSIYKRVLPHKGNIIMGNEANGISEEIKNLVDYKLSIPQFGKDKQTESLNVAMATAIVLSEFRR